MKLENLKGKKLTVEELETINAGVAPDCPPGQILSWIPGVGYVCGPLFCGWEIPEEPPQP